MDSSITGHDLCFISQQQATLLSADCPGRWSAAVPHLDVDLCRHKRLLNGSTDDSLMGVRSQSSHSCLVLHNKPDVESRAEPSCEQLLHTDSRLSAVDLPRSAAGGRPVGRPEL